jgi:DNA-binding LytR/AlgR family response regulator
MVLRKGMTEVSQKIPEIKHFENDQNTEEIITIYSKYKEGKFNIYLNKLLYIKSCDNYVDVCYSDEARIEHKLIRNTISDVEQSLSHPSLVRCHRSYIVNIIQIESVPKNRTLLQLSLKTGNTKIPVSRKFKKALLDSLKL